MSISRREFMLLSALALGMSACRLGESDKRYFYKSKQFLGISKKGMELVCERISFNEVRSGDLLIFDKDLGTSEDTVTLRLSLSDKTKKELPIYKVCDRSVDKLLVSTNFSMYLIERV